jgi:co-chaperonin GroES (HSP10)
MSTDKRRFNGDGERTGVADPPEIKVSVEPLNGWVLIRRIIRGEEKTEAGVVTLAATTSQRGEVLAVADDIPKLKLQPGDLVIFTNYPLEFDDLAELTGDENVRMVRYEEVYARYGRMK